MRLLPLLFCHLLLYLGKITVTAACVDDCESVNVTATEKEIRILFPLDTHIRNVTFADGTQANHSLFNDSVSGLEPGKQYAVYIQNSNETCCKIITTRPEPVYDLKIENVSTTTVTLIWSSNNSAPIHYIVEYKQNGESINITSRNLTATVDGLQPGTLYNFSVYPQAEDNITMGEPESVEIYTRPEPVYDLKIENVSTTAVTLIWSSNNSAPIHYIVEYKQNGESINITSRNLTVTVDGLQPGTLYNFSVYPRAEDNVTTGELQSIKTYTRPEPVYDLKIENVSTTTVTLIWSSNNSAPIHYIVEYKQNGESINITSRNLTATVHGLQPATLYNFSVYPQAEDNITMGEPESIEIYTRPEPVYDLKIENVSTTTVTLIWSSNNSAPIHYIVEYKQNGESINVTSRNLTATVDGLQPGTLYNFSVYPQAEDNVTTGELQSIASYTRPSPVNDLQIVIVGTTTVTLSWKNSDDSSSQYSYIVEYIQNGRQVNMTSRNNITTVDGLEPGTSYNFSVYPCTEDNTTTGEPRSIETYTKPSPVSDLQIVSFNTTTVTLSWKNSDNSSSQYSYVVEYVQNETQINMTSRNDEVTVYDLQPGTSYNFSVYPQTEDNSTRGEPQSIKIYTMPGPVFNIASEGVGTTEVNLTWKNPDGASPHYIYRILISSGTEADKNETVASTSAHISELIPGSNYTFSIYSVAADNHTEGSPKSINVFTFPASVEKLDCAEVAKQPELVLNWSCPAGRYDGFSITVFNSTWNKTQHCSLETQNTTLTNLSYFSSYTISIVTHSLAKESRPKKKVCSTSIGDPPTPSNPPVVTQVNHNSLNVQFSGFDSTNGPVTAYAVVISRSQDVGTESLSHTYHDFVSQKTNAYVAYVKDEQKHASIFSSSQLIDIEVGDGSNTHGYYNGKLEPLHSYSVCIVGFTHIIYKDETTGPINESRSYFSFSPSSEPVILPQNPDVIIGAVVGCILSAAVIAAVVGLIFWRKIRKNGNNDGLVFTSIVPKKSKLLRVENFESYFKKQKADSNCGFAEEYEDLRLVGVNQPKFAAELAENKGKNRYNNVLPYDISRVKLSIEDHPTDDYINANYMPGYNSKKEFIAAQGPLSNTVQDFWRMMWEKNIYTVVMLTKCIEQGRTKCEEYWPNKQSKNYGDITVAMTSEIVLPEWTIRDFSMEKSGSSENHHMRQFHFTSWPDHGVPETTDLLISFRHLVQDFMKQNPPTSPTLVHCSAGVGRTGTFIAIDRLIHQMEMENTVDVYGVVYDLRMHRSLMVQTEDQYIFLNQCVLDIIKSQKEKKADLIYQNTNAMAIYENFTPSPHIGKANGYHV